MPGAVVAHRRLTLHHLCFLAFEFWRNIANRRRPQDPVTIAIVGNTEVCRLRRGLPLRGFGIGDSLNQSVGGAAWEVRHDFDVMVEDGEFVKDRRGLAWWERILERWERLFDERGRLDVEV